MKKRIFATCILVGLVSLSHAQLADSIKVQLIKEWQRAKSYTKEYLDVVPGNKYNFRAQDSIRTFAQQMLHLAKMNIDMVSLGTGSLSLWKGMNLEKTKSAQTKDSVIYYVMSSYDYVLNNIAQMDAAKLGEKHKVANFDYMNLFWFLKAFEHQTHHRGQTTIYIRLMGLIPPDEKLL